MASSPSQRRLPVAAAAAIYATDRFVPAARRRYGPVGNMSINFDEAMPKAHTATRPEPDAPPPAEGSARERIFAVAKDLFYRQGIRAVGVETIVAQAGATKM